MKGEYFDDGGMLVEADNMTPSDATFIVPKTLRPGKVARCEFEGCTELTIFGMCGPHQTEMDRRLGEYLIKNGWTKVFGAGEDLKAVEAEDATDGKLS